jgi:thiol-disulfide isomerase/thioredoxin
VKKRNPVVFLALIAGLALMLWAGVNAVRSRNASMQTPAPAGGGPENSAVSDDTGPADAEGLLDLRGKMAPDFVLKTPDGRTVSLADFKGKAVMVNFWATWCPPCKMEIPWLIDFQKKYADRGFTVIGISEDDPPFTQVSSFAQQIGMNYPVLISDDATSKAFGGVDYLPASYYIGRDGKIVAETSGLVSKEEIEANIQKILASKGA